MHRAGRRASKVNECRRVHTSAQKKNAVRQNGAIKTGADNGARTRDPHLGKVVLYQLSHVREVVGDTRFELVTPTVSR